MEKHSKGNQNLKNYSRATVSRDEEQLKYIENN